MKFDTRKDSSSEKKDAFISWLVGETTSTFERADGDPENLKTFVFLAVNRAHEAGLTSSETAKVVGVSVARAALPPDKEDVVFDWLESLDPIATAVHADHRQGKRWWRFW